jgi:small-conductance mechanosensitive channel
MKNGNAGDISDEYSVFETKKIEFERVFGHLQSLNDSVSIGIAVEIFIIGILVSIIAAILKHDIILQGWFIPILLLLGCSFAALITALFFAVSILRRKVNDPVDTSGNPIFSDKAPKEWLHKYIIIASDEKLLRHKRWRISLYILQSTIIFVTFVGVLIIFLAKSPTNASTPTQMKKTCYHDCNKDIPFSYDSHFQIKHHRKKY